MKVWGALILSVTSVVCWSQNLVPNAGFEQFYKCPGSYNYATNGNLAPGWFSPTTGTPDLFNRCSIGAAGVPENWAGRSNTYAGVGYAGIYMFIAGRENPYREYLQTELLEPLKRGETYLVEFYFRLSSNSKYSIDRIGFLLSDSAHRIQSDGVFAKKSTFEKINYSFNTNRVTASNWVRFAYSHIATGGEKYLTIGNFSDDHDTRRYLIASSQSTEPMLSRAAYFFIDEVKVIQTSTPPAPAPPILSGYTEVNPDNDYVLKNVQFKFNEYVLLEESFSELDKVVGILRYHRAWKVLIMGHTDDVGTDEYNVDLSLQRANSVADYLIKGGINPTRLKIQGYGKQAPLKKGNDETTRAINRRVEVRFTQ
jgi:OmpA-OmpF porin, OOP family